jgi:hypothetical protein
MCIYIQKMYSKIFIEISSDDNDDGDDGGCRDSHVTGIKIAPTDVFIYCFDHT